MNDKALILNIMLRQIQANRSFFDICPVREAAEYFDIEVFRETQAYRFLCMCHCLHWQDADGETLQAMTDAIRDVFEIDPEFTVNIHTQMIPASTTQA